jgi:hypothetical protein
MLTPEQIYERAIDAAAKAIRDSAEQTESLTMSRIGDEDDAAIRDEMHRIATKVQAGGLL